MLYYAPYTKIPEMLNSGMKPQQMMLAMRTFPPCGWHGIRQIRDLAPSEILTKIFLCGGIDEYSFRFLYDDYLTLHIPPERLRKVFDFRGTRAVVVGGALPIQAAATDVLGRWVDKHVATCKPWIRTIEGDLFADIW